MDVERPQQSSPQYMDALDFRCHSQHVRESKMMISLPLDCRLRKNDKNRDTHQLNNNKTHTLPIKKSVYCFRFFYSPVKLFNFATKIFCAIMVVAP